MTQSYSNHYKQLTRFRGEIAIRILSSARELNLETYTLYTADDTSHTLHSTHAVSIPSPSTYLDISALIAIIKALNIDAVHPGYGFLSESAEFAHRAWTEAGAVVIGPGWETLARTGDKLAARQLAEECKVPVLPALQTPTNNVEDVRRFAAQIGWPIIIKAVDGGGGRGIRIVREEGDLAGLMERALRESPQGLVFAEKAAVDGYRHVEVQIVGDGTGNVRHLWERECSIQRRFQKVVEFAPSSIRDRGVVGRVIEAAMRMARKVSYLSLGTFEFLVHNSNPEFYFLEVNPRLQVEHTITESLCPGLDLVKVQLCLATGQELDTLLPNISRDPLIPPPLHSLQLRITAEDATANWALNTGTITSLTLPSGNGIRVDHHLTPGLVIKTDFDSLLAKIVITASSWPDLVAKAIRALNDTHITGVKTSLPALRGILAHPAFTAQACDTQWLETTLPALLATGTSNTASLPSPAPPSATPAFAPSSSSAPLRKGDAWSLTLTPTTTSPSSSTPPPAPAHLLLTKLHRNDFPASLTADIVFTPPSAPAISYTLALTSTAASAGALTSSHRRGEAGNARHIVFPFPGQLVELLVDVGDHVEKGDVVAVVKQMKMELEIRAGMEGVVGWVFEGEDGDEVGEGVLAVELVEEGGRAKL
jgi:pyruvate carboxylase